MSPFGHWLRTGRWLPEQIADPTLEVKFNPNHDPKDGRFTFRQGGGTAASAARPKPPRPLKRGNGRWGGGFNGRGGGSFGGAGAGGDGYWVNDRERAAFRQSHPDPDMQPHMASPGETLTGIANSSHIDVATGARPNNLRADAKIKPGDILAIPARHRDTQRPLKNIPKNGYYFGIDTMHRTHEVRGNLYLAGTARRSKLSQRQAGGHDRRAGDDGGHFIAARFGGPTEAFNHFAQDASFNRGSYRAIEDSWAKELRSGKHVSVDIKAYYAGASRRPSSLGITWVTNGHRRFREFLNEPKGTRHGR